MQEASSNPVPTGVHNALPTAAQLRATLLRRVHPGWEPVFAASAKALDQVLEFLLAEIAAGNRIHPNPEQVLRAYEQDPAKIKVLIVGQDPYPTPHHAIGLSFATDPHITPLPRSLNNIFRELHQDLGVAPASSGDLRGWQEQGVMLLNRVLTVRSGAAGSHQQQGWEQLTENTISFLNSRDLPLVAFLWGNQARSLQPLMPQAHIIASAHPSPLSAHRGFFGSRPFSRANAYLSSRGVEQILW